MKSSLNRKPRIKKGMSTFAGCDIGELRVGLLKSLLTPDHDYIKLEKQGYLESRDDGKRVWFFLTLKGKQHLQVWNDIMAVCCK